MTAPQDILAQINHPPEWPGWIPTKHGGFRPFEPKVEDVIPEDIIYGLCGAWRFGGRTVPRMTVAEHVVLVSLIIEELWGPKYAAAGLLHDACEAYTHDLPAPIRGSITVALPSGEVVSWMEMERRINLVIFEALGVDPAGLDALEVRAADILSATFEKRDSQSLSSEEDWGLPPIPAEIAPWRLNFFSPPMAEITLRRRWEKLGLPL